MRALEIQDYAIEKIKLVTRPIPRPGAGEVVLRMKAVALNYRDLATVLFPRLAVLPLVPLSDGCGDVISVGEGVTRVVVGDRVCPIFYPNWVSGPATEYATSTSLGGGALDGCAQEYMCVPANCVSKIPSYLTYDEAATLPCAGLTAWHGLVVAGHLKAGDIVLIQGTGGVSIFALQFAKAMGAQVVLISSSDTKLEKGHALGADRLINYEKTPEWGKEVLQLTGGRGADHVVEIGGAHTLEQSMMALRHGGHIAIIGARAGHQPPLNVIRFMGKSIRMSGVLVGSRDYFDDMVSALEVVKIRPVIDRQFAFDDAQDAYRHLQTAAHFGKVVIKIN